MNRTARLSLALPLAALLGSACALPHGSYARPVNPADQGTMLIGSGAIVPFFFSGSVSPSDSDSVSASGFTDSFTLIPSGSFDYAIGKGSYLGAEFSLLKVFSVGDASPTGIFVNPRWEMALGDDATRNLAFTLEGNFIYFTDGTSTNDGGSNSVVFAAPHAGLRYYQPIGDIGGLILTQTIGTSILTLTLPGGIGFDLNLGVFWDPLRIIHIVPELRWDPTLVFTDIGNGSFIFLSAGGTVLLEF
jgi:hypothetical protein